MLVIGDIHITTKRAPKILQCIRSFLQKFPEETDIIFVGDYVYHFSYDRKALLQLFQLFLHLFVQGKRVYILAGNHDRIGGHFVYEEAKQSFELLQKAPQESFGELHFITTPQFFMIEGNEYLFFPFYNPALDVPIAPWWEHLATSSHHGEQHAARANSELQRYVMQRREQPQKTTFLTIVHHRYIADTTFPGQQTIFSYKNPALSAWWLHEPDIKLLSWHIHKPFCLENYLCTGSLRSTSSLEFNQMKYVYRILADGSVEAHPAQINPYLRFSISPEMMVDETVLRAYEMKTAEQQAQTLQQGKRALTVYPPIVKPVSDISLILESNEISYEHLGTVVASELLEKLADIKIKKPYRALPDISQELDMSSLELDKSIADRKTLLRRYLHSKYGDAAGQYETLLAELSIL